MNTRINVFLASSDPMTVEHIPESPYAYTLSLGTLQDGLTIFCTAASYEALRRTLLEADEHLPATEEVTP